MVAQQTARVPAGDEAAGDQNAQPSLTTLIRVPKTMLGRLVGRGGSSIRETQHYSGAFLKLPKHSKQNGGGADEKQADTPERDALETVEISGTYIATQVTFLPLSNPISYGLWHYPYDKAYTHHRTLD